MTIRASHGGRKAAHAHGHTHCGRAIRAPDETFEDRERIAEGDVQLRHGRGPLIHCRDERDATRPRGDHSVLTNGGNERIADAIGRPGRWKGPLLGAAVREGRRHAHHRGLSLLCQGCLVGGGPDGFRLPRRCVGEGQVAKEKPFALPDLEKRAGDVLRHAVLRAHPGHAEEIISEKIRQCPRASGSKLIRCGNIPDTEASQRVDRDPLPVGADTPVFDRAALLNIVEAIHRRHSGRVERRGSPVFGLEGAAFHAFCNAVNGRMHRLNGVCFALIRLLEFCDGCIASGLGGKTFSVNPIRSIQNPVPHGFLGCDVKVLVDLDDRYVSRVGDRGPVP